MVRPCLYVFCEFPELVQQAGGQLCAQFRGDMCGASYSCILFPDVAFDVIVGECHIGGTVDVPTQVSSKDNLFGR